MIIKDPEGALSQLKQMPKTHRSTWEDLCSPKLPTELPPGNPGVGDPDGCPGVPGSAPAHSAWEVRPGGAVIRHRLSSCTWSPGCLACHLSTCLPLWTHTSIHTQPKGILEKPSVMVPLFALNQNHRIICAPRKKASMNIHLAWREK